LGQKGSVPVRWNLAPGLLPSTDKFSKFPASYGRKDVAAPVSRSCAGHPCHWRRLGISPLAEGVLFWRVNCPPFLLFPSIWPLARADSLNAHTRVVLHVNRLGAVCWLLWV